jgi:hypothetical protein
MGRMGQQQRRRRRQKQQQQQQQQRRGGEKEEENAYLWEIGVYVDKEVKKEAYGGSY